MFELVASIEKVGDVLPKFKFLVAFGKTDVLVLLLSSMAAVECATGKRGGPPKPAHTTWTVPCPAPSALPQRLHACSYLPGPSPKDHRGHMPHVDIQQSLVLIPILLLSYTGLCFVSKVSAMLSCAQLFPTLWTGARQVPLSMEFSRREY